jgi:hypothetical protein
MFRFSSSDSKGSGTSARGGGSACAATEEEENPLVALRSLLAESDARLLALRA